MKMIGVFLALLLYLGSLQAFDKVVIWGHKLGTHTHAYVHNGFFIAFKHMGIPTYWFDDQDDVSKFDFRNTLFLTEGQVDLNMPLRDDCKYILHNPRTDKYLKLPEKNWFMLQVFRDDVMSLPSASRVEECVYYDILNKCVYMPWATDLLPHEINEVKNTIHSNKHRKVIYWVGSFNNGWFGNQTEIDPFIKACKENGIQFVVPQGATTTISREENQHLTNVSYLAPTIVGKWQKEVGYIPCRIFKNISYGQMGVTNSKRVWELFERKVVYNSDTYQLFYDAKKRIAKMKDRELFELMEMVRDRHTYLNRIKTLLDFFDLLDKESDT